MKDIQEVVNHHVAELAESGKLQEVVEQSVEAAITKAVKSQFESYGSITKQIEKAVEEGLQINVKELPFAVYNEQMLVAVKQRLGNLFAGAASERFMQSMDELLSPVPQEMELNDFVNQVVLVWKTDEPWDADELDEYATVELEHNTYGGYSLKMWKQKDSSDYLGRGRERSEDLHIYISSDGEIRINHRQNYNPTCFSEHEALVFKMYAAGTVLTGLEDFDADDCELTLKEIDY